MNEAIEERYVAPGDADHVDATWLLKERIRRRDGVLVQEEHFFRFQYQRCGVHLTLVDGDPVAFAILRADGYLSLLGVAPEFRRRGLGGRLVERVAERHERITCHTNVDNESAVAFYTDLGFVVENRIEGYYRDGTDAFRLELSADGSDRLERIMAVLSRDRRRSGPGTG